MGKKAADQPPPPPPLGTVHHVDGDGDGTLKIHITRGRRLAAMDRWTSASDPYVNVYYGETLVGKTGVVKHTTNPVWRDGLVHCATHGPPCRKPHKKVTLELFDGAGTRDDALGRVVVDVGLGGALERRLAIPKKWYDVLELETKLHGVVELQFADDVELYAWWKHLSKVHDRTLLLDAPADPKAQKFLPEHAADRRRPRRCRRRRRRLRVDHGAARRRDLGRGPEGREAGPRASARPRRRRRARQRRPSVFAYRAFGGAGPQGDVAPYYRTDARADAARRGRRRRDVGARRKARAGDRLLQRTNSSSRAGSRPARSPSPSSCGRPSSPSTSSGPAARTTA
ncbi:hypothetical protein JL721_9460 [Aureococcus anophagefferens]|nr:hypothetical protein JL721_9460 [Aureococcus anophagefferens]